MKFMLKSTLKNKDIRHPINLNWQLYRQQRIKCAKTAKKNMKEYTSKITSNGIITIKTFQKP